MEDLIQQYKDSMKRVREAKRAVPKREDRSEEERMWLSTLNRCESNLRYALDWLQTGREPGSRRGIERLAAYQRERGFDPMLLDDYLYSLDEGDRLSSSRQYDPFFMMDQPRHNKITQSDKERIEEGLSGLTDLERDVYLMARGRCLSREQIASLLGVTKGTINKMLIRADEKVAHRSQTSLFCLPNAN
ncbi:RNA polymerase sigma-70 factor, ECF subfamily [Marininema mesophilum]|uniref:RNA polymerase sigma-70 factor, ECF subfamily n=1 Tax=Marininema mesophilum TaxID=1048340 RepID=A0A1H3BWE3_9BACL|nr:sigma factor-like helix-turn-helix DNA-binding protein [Marininema mesophilum]SDX45694.1 RNA polymerase sigma-70 factor, ECF subfamily [Marininema mesophilum]